MQMLKHKGGHLHFLFLYMKGFNIYLIEKLKVNTNKHHDPRDYETVDMLSKNALDKRKFREYLQDCLKRDKYDMQSSDFEFHNNKVLFYYEKYLRNLCDYSVNDTYIELYDRIIDTLKEDHFIHEKLKVHIDISNNQQDDEPVGDLSDRDTGNKFLEYVYARFKQDNIKTSRFIFGNTKDIITIFHKHYKKKVKYSEYDTYIEVYDRIIDTLRAHKFITEKLKVSSKNIKDYNKEYKNKTNKVTYYNAHKYHSYILEVDNMDLFMDYWYYFLESEDEALKENLGIRWDDIYLDYDGQDVYVLDNNTGDEIVISYDENPRTFYNIYNRIIRYFEDKNE